MKFISLPSREGKEAVLTGTSSPALRKQRQGDLCELEASLFYIVSSRLARANGEILSKKKKKANWVEYRPLVRELQSRSFPTHSFQVARSPVDHGNVCMLLSQLQCVVQFTHHMMDVSRMVPLFKYYWQSYKISRADP